MGSHDQNMKDFAFHKWFIERADRTVHESEAFGAGWRAADAHRRVLALLGRSGHESCSEMTRNALEAATDPSERTVTLTLDEIEALLCAWELEEYPHELRPTLVLRTRAPKRS